MSPLLRVSRPALLNLAVALEHGRLQFPVYARSLSGFVPAELGVAVAAELQQLYSKGSHPPHIAFTLRMMAAERKAAQGERDKVSLVWTGHEVAGSEGRDTSIVVRELFAAARSHVLISSYALDKGIKARHLFQDLANRMVSEPSLRVSVYLNIKRSHNDDRSESVIVREFCDHFRKEIWPGTTLPALFHDPRSLAAHGNQSRACLHAKCVAIDDQKLFITSANFTEAAHERNIEAGILLADSWAARSVRLQFENLVASRILRPVVF